MGSVPLAFSVHHFINSVGSDAGFAAIIGLAVLILLYFAQARETASLREQIYEWAQRVQQLEARVTQLSRQQASLPMPSQAPATVPPSPRPYGQPAAAPVPAAAAAAAAGAAGAAGATFAAPAAGRVPAMAGAPAGTAAPALTAATKLIPGGDVATAEPARAPFPADLPPDATAVVSPQPVTVAGGAPLGPSAPAPAPAAAPGAGGSNGSSYDHLPPEPASLPTAAPPPRMQIRQGTTQPPGRRGTVPPRNQQSRPQRRQGRRGFAILLVALVAVAVVAGVLILTNNSSNTSKQAATTGSRSTNAAAAQHRTKAAAVTPSAVNVAVLNGTAVNGLAGRIQQKLTTDGYKPAGKPATAADQTRTSTEVAYMPGHRRDAIAVARSLNLGQASVQAVDPSTQALACPPPAACNANVVVTAGTDLANTQ